MAKEWQVCSEVRDLVEALSQRFTANFSNVNSDEISCIMSVDGKAPKQGAGKALAKISIIREKMRVATGTPYKYIIEVYDDNWFDLSKIQKQYVIFHELMHIDPDSEEPKLKDHDIQDFDMILSAWGIHYLEDAKLLDLLDDDMEEGDYEIKDLASLPAAAVAFSEGESNSS